MRGARIPYSAAEIAWLEANREMVISDYHAAFQAAFPRPDVTAGHLHSLRKRKGWKVGRAKGRLAGRHRAYSPAELQWLRANQTLPLADCHREFVATFDRPDVTAQKLHSLRKRLGLRTGRSGHFEPGHVSANKGKRCPDGVGGRHPNAKRTQFRKGAQPANTKWLGYERINVDGYIEISVAETNPYTGYERRFVHKHVWLWEQANGPVPDEHCLKCLDGNRLNTDPANWEAIPRGLLPRLNGGRASRLSYDQAAPEIRPVILTLAKVEHQARTLKRRSAA